MRAVCGPTAESPETMSSSGTSSTSAAATAPSTAAVQCAP